MVLIVWGTDRTQSEPLTVDGIGHHRFCRRILLLRFEHVLLTWETTRRKFAARLGIYSTNYIVSRGSAKALCQYAAAAEHM